MHPSATTADGPARQRIDALGERVLLLPAYCRAGLHDLTAHGYQIRITAGLVHIRCAACARVGGLTQSWRLHAPSRPCPRAEFDATAYPPPPRAITR